MALEKRKQLFSVILISIATICTSLDSYSRDLQRNFNQSGTNSVFSELRESKNKELNKGIHGGAELVDPFCQSIPEKSYTEKPDGEEKKKKTTN